MSASYEKLLISLGGFGVYQCIVVLFLFSATLATAPHVSYWVYVGRIPSVNETFTNETGQMLIAKEWNLTDTRAYICTLINLVQFAGLGVGNLFVGQIADRFGRRPALLIAAVGTNICSLLSSQCVTWLQFLFARLFLGIFVGCNITVCYTMTAEHILPKHRFFAMSYFHWPIALMLVALMAYLSTTWRMLGLIETFSGLPDIIMIIFLSESPKWLIERGEYTKAKIVIKRMATYNRTTKNLTEIHRRFKTCCDELTPPSDSLLQDSEAVQPETHKEHKPTYYYWNLCYSRKATLETIAFDFSFVTVALVSYGLAFNVPNLQGHISINAALENVIRLAVITVAYVLDLKCKRFGRHIMHRTGLTVTGLCCLLLAIVYGLGYGDKYPNVVKTAALVGSSATEFQWAAVTLYGSELFPTVLRAMGYALANAVGRLGVMTATQTTLFFVIWPALPFIIFTSMTAICLALSIAFLPNTKNKPLPDIGHRKLAKGGSSSALIGGV